MQFYSKTPFSALKTCRSKSAIALSENEYFCHNCGQQFTVYWNLRASRFNSWIPRGSFTLCPYCGRRHDEKVLAVVIDEPAPFAIAVKLYEFKQKLILTVDYSAQAFGEQKFEINAEQGKETFTFDFAARSAYFQKTVQSYYRNETPYEKTACATITELTMGEIARISVLRHINGHSFLYEDKNVSAFLKEFYKIMKTKLQTMHGQQIKNLYINTRGLSDGLFLRALFNYAGKMPCPEKTVDRTGKIECRHKLQWINTFGWTAAVKKEFAARQHIGIDAVTATVTATGLPDKKTIRQIIAGGGNIVLLCKALTIFSNLDYALRFYRALEAQPYGGHINRFIKYARKMYGDREIVSFLETGGVGLTKDILRLYCKLDKNYRRRLFREKVKISKLHNWLVDTYNAQRDKGLQNVPLAVPEHIARRLTMQLDTIKFYLPETSKALLRAGRELRNCVASYTDRINQREATIVFMSNDKGKLIACINVSNETIVEAKLFDNKPLCTNYAVNEAVLLWSKKAGLTVGTRDIAIADEKGEKLQAS
jgi:hypothetical protein